MKKVIVLFLLIPINSFAFSLNFFDNVDEKLRDNITPEMQKYNDAVDLYNSGLYEAGINKLYEITCLEWEFCAKIQSSLWTFMYKNSIWKNLETRIEILKEAKKEYIESLKIEFDEWVNKNKDLIEKEIVELEEELKNRKEEYEKEKEKQNSNQEKKSPSEDQEFEKETWEAYAEGGGDELTEEERELIDKRSQDLELQEKMLQAYFNKFYDKNWNQFNPSFYALFWIIPENKFNFFKDTKKDW